MKLTEAFKERAEGREQAREAIEATGAELTDVELDGIAGGIKRLVPKVHGQITGGQGSSAPAFGQ